MTGCLYLWQYSLGVKRDEMRKLEEIAQAEEKKLELAEQYLEEDAALFDEFLKENDRNASEAIKVYVLLCILFICLLSIFVYCIIFLS